MTWGNDFVISAGNTVRFTTAEPTDVGVVFTPDFQEEVGRIYMSDTDQSLWGWDGSNYVRLGGTELTLIPEGSSNTVFVDPVSGDNANDGLTIGTAVASIWRAQEIHQTFRYAVGSTAIIQLQDGTHLVNGQIDLLPLNLSSPTGVSTASSGVQFFLQGNASNPDATIIETNSTINAIKPGAVTIRNLAITPSGLSGQNIISVNHADTSLSLSNININAHVSASNLGTVIGGSAGQIGLAGVFRTRFSNCAYLVGAVNLIFNKTGTGAFDFQNPVTMSGATYRGVRSQLHLRHLNDLNTGNVTGSRFDLSRSSSITSAEGTPTSLTFSSLPGTTDGTMDATCTYGGSESPVDLTTSGAIVTLSNNVAGRKVRLISPNATLRLDAINAPVGTVTEYWNTRDIIIPITTSGTTFTGQTSVPPEGFVFIRYLGGNAYEVTGPNRGEYVNRVIAATTVRPGSYEVSSTAPYSITLSSGAGVWKFYTSNGTVATNNVTIVPPVGGLMSGPNGVLDQASLVLNSRGIEVVVVNETGNTQYYVTVTGRPTSTIDTSTITQTAHGFTVGLPVRISGPGTYTAARADSQANLAGMVGLVATVPSVDTFTIAKIGGRVEGFTSTPGATYYVNPAVGGGLVTTAPVAPDIASAVAIGGASGTSLEVGSFIGV